MPIIKSAKKRVRVASKATARNSKTKRSLKSAIKAFQSSLSDSKAKAPEALRQAQSEVAKAGKKRVLHKNKVARKQRQLARAAKAAGVKPAGRAKKPVVAKVTPKKPIAKKPTAKKTPTKKPAAKKK
jgi:small subunit ribosomal protein S20